MSTVSTMSARREADAAATQGAQPSSGRPAPERRQTTRYGYAMGPTGERFDFATSARTSADKTFRFVWGLAPGKKGPGEHYHPTETETFEIVSGRIRIWLDGVANDYGPGDVCVVRAGVRHKFLNPGTEPVVINVSLDGPQMEDVLVPIAVATADQPKARVSDFLRMAATLDCGASVPASRGERAVISVIASVLRFFGARPFPPAIGWDQPSARG